MRSSLSAPLLLLLLQCVDAQAPTHSKCRFAELYTIEDIPHNSTKFLQDVFYWEGQFHQDGVGYNQQNGMTYDGVGLDSNTGLAKISARRPFSSASQEVEGAPHINRTFVLTSSSRSRS